MQNTRKINGIPFWVNGTSIEANHLMLCFFSGYDFTENSGGFVTYRIGMMTEDSNQYIPFAENSVALPAELIATWGEDDEPIWQYVMNVLNLTPAP
jgi:hypothetical protein